MKHYHFSVNRNAVVLGRNSSVFLSVNHIFESYVLLPWRQKNTANTGLFILVDASRASNQSLTN